MRGSRFHLSHLCFDQEHSVASSTVCSPECPDYESSDYAPVSTGDHDHHDDDPDDRGDYDVGDDAIFFKL